MIEQGKSVLLFLLVVVSLIQSYFLAYSMPYMDPKVKTDLKYVETEQLGSKDEITNLIFPEQMVLHMGDDKHTVFYPGTRPYYELILTKLIGREFKGIQQNATETIDWNQIRRENHGVELRFGRAVPFELLQRVFKIDGDFGFSRDSIDRIWIYAGKGRDEVRTFFFSADGVSVYESLRADLTIGDVEGYVGFGQYWDPYTTTDGHIYVPEKPINRLLEMTVPFTRFTTAQMQDNLLFDPGTTQTIPNDKNDPQFYTDGKKSLSVEQDGGWLAFTDPVAPTDSENNLIDNVMAAVNFVNDRGGWNGKHQLVKGVESEKDSIIRFQQYFRDVPIVSDERFNFGFMQMTLQQGVVSTYDRSLIMLGKEVTNKNSRTLPGGKALRELLAQYESVGNTIDALFPAYRPSMTKDAIVLHPVWAVRMKNGDVNVLTGT